MHPLGTFIHKYARRIMAVLGLALLLAIVIFNGYVLADVGCRPLTEVELAALAAQGDVDTLSSPFTGIDIGENLDVNLGFIFFNIASGDYKFEDYSAQLEEFANGILAAARAEIGQ